MKKLVLFFVLTAFAAGGIFAQEKYDGSFKNTIFFGPIIAGYERTIINGFSVGAEAGLNLFGFGSNGDFYVSLSFVNAIARWYPWKKTFFVNLGLGLQGGGLSTSDSSEMADGFLINPQVGWKIDIGNAGAWIFEARAGFGITLSGDGTVTTITIPLLFGRTF